MDDNRAQTLQALEAFIQTQRNLLARQWSDIDRLQQLRVDLVQRPSQILTNLGNELDDSAFRLSDQADCRLKLPKDIDWSVFQKSDTGPLQTFAQRNRDEISERTRPSLVQRSELSELQRFVKQARRTILDPILSRFADMSSPEPESEEDIDPVELKRQQEQQKIRELKKRQIRSCGLSLPLSSISGTMGVIIRPDVEDEAMDVDVTIDDDDNDKGHHQSSIPAADIDSDTPPVSQATPLVDLSLSSAPPVKVTASGSGVRVRRPSKKAISQSIDDENSTFALLSDNPRPRKKVKLKLPPKATLDNGDSSPPEEPEEPKKTKKRNVNKPKPETHKQAWSESEQNLLEQLLDEIPDGEKNRWQQISQAMGGRRTARQVASRVQKYFEKLKRFGIGVNGGGG